MTKIYIAGPMKGIPLFNFPAFDAVRDSLNKWPDFVAVSPADIDRQNGFDPSFLPEDYDWSIIPPSAGTRTEILRRDVDALLECEAIYMLPGWEHSVGAKAELHLARWAGLQVYHDESAKSLMIVDESVDRIHPKQQAACNPKDLIGVTKPPQHCIPLPVLWEIGMAMCEGGWKYRDHNYRKIGVQASVYYDAARRHLDAWWEGENIDPQSGLNHITKVMSCLTVLRDCMMQSEAGAPVEFQDDRPPKSFVTMEMAEEQFKVMLERLEREHGECKPPYTERG